MSPIAEDIKKLTASEKAEIYYLLGSDEELNNYLLSDKRLFDKLARRDEEYATGNMQLMMRGDLPNGLMSVGMVYNWVKLK